MPSLGTLATFVVIVAAFAAVPGPSNLYVVAQGLSAGRRAALAAALGCASGAMIYVVATAVGLAAVLASSTVVLTGLHYLGGAYLVYLGVRALRAGTPAADVHPVISASASTLRSFRQGVLAEVGNPKVALFFLAFFPQFLHADRGPTWTQVVVLGAVFCLVGLVSDTGYALASGTLQTRLRNNPRALVRSRQVSGVMYLALGTWAFASGSRAHARPA